MVWLLLPFEGSSSRALYCLPLGATTVGRARSDIVVQNDNTISRKQCEFIVEAPTGVAVVHPKLYVKDLSRYNTTYLNGADITSTNRMVELASGDAVKIGSASEGFRVLDVPLLVYCTTDSDKAQCDAAGVQTVDSVEAAALLLLPGEADPSDTMVLSAVVLGKPVVSSAAVDILMNGGKRLNLTTVASGIDWSADYNKAREQFHQWFVSNHLPPVSSRACPKECAELLEGYLSSANDAVNRRQLFTTVHFHLQSPEARRCLDQSLRFTSACMTAEPQRGIESTVYVDGEKPSPAVVGSLPGAVYYSSIVNVIACILWGHMEGRFSLIGAEGSAERLRGQEDNKEVDSAHLRPRVSLKPLERPIVEEDTDMTVCSPTRGVALEEAKTPERPIVQTSTTMRRAMKRSPLCGSHTRALAGSGGWHCKRHRIHNEATAERPEEGSVPIPVAEFTRELKPDEHAKEASVHPEEVNYKAFRRRGCQVPTAPTKMPPIQLVTFTPDLADSYGNAEEDLRLFDEVPGLRQRYLARRR